MTISGLAIMRLPDTSASRCVSGSMEEEKQDTDDHQQLPVLPTQAAIIMLPNELCKAPLSALCLYQPLLYMVPPDPGKVLKHIQCSHGKSVMFSCKAGNNQNV